MEVGPSSELFLAMWRWWDTKNQNFSTLGRRYSVLGTGEAGHFSVKSAYNLALDEAFHADVVGSSILLDGRRTYWKLLRSCNVPPTFISFAWRLSTDSLPTRKNKYKMNLKVTAVCPVCRTKEEDNYHPLCRCPLATQYVFYVDAVESERSLEYGEGMATASAWSPARFGEKYGPDDALAELACT